MTDVEMKDPAAASSSKGKAAPKESGSEKKKFEVKKVSREPWEPS